MLLLNVDHFKKKIPDFQTKTITNYNFVYTSSFTMSANRSFTIRYPAPAGMAATNVNQTHPQTVFSVTSPRPTHGAEGQHGGIQGVQFGMPLSTSHNSMFYRYSSGDCSLPISQTNPNSPSVPTVVQHTPDSKLSSAKSLGNLFNMQQPLINPNIQTTNVHHFGHPGQVPVGNQQQPSVVSIDNLKAAFQAAGVQFTESATHVEEIKSPETDFQLLPNESLPDFVARVQNAGGIVVQNPDGTISCSFPESANGQSSGNALGNVCDPIIEQPSASVDAQVSHEASEAKLTSNSDLKT